MQDTFSHNREAWNRAVAEGNQWTTPVSSDVIARARNGEWAIVVTATKHVPRVWFGDLNGKDVLTLASGGGQQAPILAAAGARVTSFDASDAQLAQDAMVAARDGLSVRTLQGDMRDLSVFASASFDLVVNACSTCFIDDVEQVWREVSRVLRPGGVLITGFVNPWFYLFNEAAFDRGELVVSNRLPYADKDRPQDQGAAKDMFEWSHTLEAQIGGQLRVGLQLTGMYEDEWDQWAPLVGVAPTFIATRAVKV